MDKKRFIRVISFLSVLLLGVCFIATPCINSRAEELRHIVFDIEEPVVSGSQGYLVLELNDVNAYGEWRYEVFFWTLACCIDDRAVPTIMDIDIQRGIITFTPRSLSANDWDGNKNITISRYSAGKFEIVASESYYREIEIDYALQVRAEEIWGAHYNGNIGRLNFSGIYNNGKTSYFSYSFGGGVQIPDKYAYNGVDHHWIYDKIIKDEIVNDDIDDIYDEMFDRLEDVEIDIDVDSIDFYGDFLKMVFVSSYVRDMIVLAFSLGLIAYLLFGRKG